jgi:hypothetical protein
MEPTPGTPAPTPSLPTPEELAALAKASPEVVRDKLKSLPFVRDWGSRGVRVAVAFTIGAAIKNNVVPQAFADYAGNYLTGAITGAVAYAGLLLRDKVAATPEPPVKWVPAGLWNVVRKVVPYLPI